MARLSEDELIARHFAPMAGPAGLSLRDDAACLAPRPGYDLVLTVDAIVAGVHFLPDDPPGDIAAKALGVNLSDLAAKGAEPVGYLLALALPDAWTDDWLTAFCAGLAATAERSGCPLLGGDTVRAAGPLSLTVTAIGSVPAGTMVRRTTARPGDLLCVTGTIGDAALGLALLQRGDDPSPPGEGESKRQLRPGWGHPAGLTPPRSASPTRPSPAGEGSAAMSPLWHLAPDHRAFLIDRYRRPRPRLALAPALRRHASAAMDVSDGLVGDAAKLLRSGGVTGTIDLDRLPLSPAARAALAAEPACLDRIAGGGDDYEVLFTLPPERWDDMRSEAAALGLAVTAIGDVRDGTEPLSLRRGGSPYGLANPSFQHFGSAPP